MDGVINIYKQKGFTSHDVVAIVRKTINQKKVGHTGTLDPDAEGVLPICIGKATKIADYIMNGNKKYTAYVKLGTVTNTDDSSGEIIKQSPVDFDEEKIRIVVKSFEGNISQIPPMYSAIKINGKKLYELARQGKEVYRKPRNVTIYSVNITEFIPPLSFKIEVECSKGTYIRTLCHDIGEKLGCGAHMEKLIRTSSGNFDIESSITIDELKELYQKGEINKAVKTLNDALNGYHCVNVFEKAQNILINGGKIYGNYFSVERKPDYGCTVVAYGQSEQPVGLYTYLFDSEKNMDYIKPLRLF